VGDEKPLTVIEQREVEFYEDRLTAVRAGDGHIYVAVGQMCSALGLTTAPQTRRIKRHAVLNAGYQGITIMVTPGGRQETGMIRADLVPLWLSGIRTNMVKEEIRPKLERFQAEAARVLWEAFQEGRLTTELNLDELVNIDPEAVQAYHMAQAVVKLARSHLLLRSEVEDHSRRLETIEATLGDPGRHVSPDQASQISQAVKAVAIALGRQTKRNEFGAVYGELYRKFGITSYKQLPARRFQEAIDWLAEWHQNLTGDVPF